MDASTEEQVNDLISDKDKFNKFVYTPFDDALKELASRRADQGLREKLSGLLPDIPLPFVDGPRAVLFRQVATPNYEARRFASLVEQTEGISPLIMEFHDDKFTSNNYWKYSLGRMFFYTGKDKSGNTCIEKKTIVDFAHWDGKTISSVETTWKQNLVELHRELFDATYLRKACDTKDISSWLAQNGSSAQNYYINVLHLFIANGILFENFMLDKKELSFTKNVFLPIFIEIIKNTGLKPLIVALEPTDIEGDDFWLCHPQTSIEVINNKLNSV